MHWIIERHDRVGSTMDLAAERARAGAPAGVVIVAGEQTSGRGQRGRRWDAPPGTSLLCTLISRPALAPAELASLPLEVAERVSGVITRLCGVECNVKPPNDVICGGHKIAGVLCQSTTEGDAIVFALIGIGVNINIAEADLPVDTATSLLVETGSYQHVCQILGGLLDDFEHTRWFHDRDGAVV